MKEKHLLCKIYLRTNNQDPFHQLLSIRLSLKIVLASDQIFNINNNCSKTRRMDSLVQAVTGSVNRSAIKRNQGDKIQLCTYRLTIIIILIT